MLESGDQKKKWSVKAQRWNCAVSLEYRLLNRCTNEKPLIVFFDWKQLYNHLSSSSAILQRLSVNRRELSSVFKPGRVFWGSRQSLLFIDWQNEQLKIPTRAKLSLTAATTTRLLRRDFGLFLNKYYSSTNLPTFIYKVLNRIQRSPKELLHNWRENQVVAWSDSGQENLDQSPDSAVSGCPVAELLAPAHMNTQQQGPGLKIQSFFFRHMHLYNLCLFLVNSRYTNTGLLRHTHTHTHHTGLSCTLCVGYQLFNIFQGIGWFPQVSV